MAIKSEEERHIISHALFEIKRLRSENARMKDRLDMFDSCMALFNVRKETNGMTSSDDIVHNLEKLVAEYDNNKPA